MMAVLKPFTTVVICAAMLIAEAQQLASTDKKAVQQTTGHTIILSATPVDKADKNAIGAQQPRPVSTGSDTIALSTDKKHLLISK